MPWSSGICRAILRLVTRGHSWVRVHQHALRAIVASVIVLGAAPSCPSISAPFDGTGTLISGRPYFFPDTSFYWDGGGIYAIDQVDTFSIGSRVHVRGDQLESGLAVDSIWAAGPFEECGRLETDEFCPYLVYLGRYKNWYVIWDSGGFSPGDSVRVTLSFRTNYPESFCMMWPWWNVISIAACDSATPVSRVSWGAIRGLYR
jgi:hypothetical protein